MFIVHSDSVFRVAPGTTPDYNSGNPLLRLLDLVARARFAAERQAYLQQHLQYLFPYDFRFFRFKVRGLGFLTVLS